MVAASIADPLVEYASNKGWFGPGTFTDYSNWNVAPALTLGLIFVALHLFLRVCKALAGVHLSPDWPRVAIDALGPNIIRLVPIIFAAQLVALYAIETAEQRVIYGHLLGSTIWLGGPILVSLGTHAVMCVLVTLVTSLVLRAFSYAAIRFVQAVQVIARLAAVAAPTVFLGDPSFAAHHDSNHALGRIGERAPPIPTA